MKNRKLIHIYMFYITLAISGVMLLNLLWSVRAQEEISKRNMLAKAQIITEQFLSVRTFVAAHQDRINYDSQGNFEFKFLNPAAVGRGVGQIFNEKTEYTFKQTDLAARNPDNKPDDFEMDRILWLQNHPQTEYIWEEDLVDGKRVFRYMVPLYADPSCLPCHGTPLGEPDISGYAREGLQAGDFAGAISVTIPAQAYYDQLRTNMLTQITFFLIMLFLTVFVLFMLQKNLITSSLEGLTAFAVQVGKGDFIDHEPRRPGRGEIRVLEEQFRVMAKELAAMYRDLEEKVNERTADLYREKEKLARMNEELNKLNQLQSEFLASVSHELRTPLACILALVELLEEPVLLEQRSQNLKDLGYSAKQLMNMINNLLDTAKMDAGMLQFDLGNHDAVAIVSDVVKAFEPLVRERNITLQMLPEENILPVLCNAERVKQVLVNLIGNALKFTGAGGTVTVHIAKTQLPGRVIFRVKDTGPGVSEEEKTTIFDRFRQGNAPFNSRQPGSGLGLYLAKGLVELQGGEMGVESIPGQGATFYFTLPVGNG